MQIPATALHRSGLFLGVYLIILLLETVLMALFSLSLPNQLRFPPIEQFDLYQAMWESSPWNTLRNLFTSDTWLLIESRRQPGSVQVWGIYYSSLSVLTHIVVTVLTMAWISATNSRFMEWAGTIFPTVSLLLISVLTIQHVSCCSTGPGRVIEVAFRALALSPAEAGTINWFAVYNGLELWFQPAQIFMGVLGIGLLILTWRNRHRSFNGAG